MEHTNLSQMETSGPLSLLKRYPLSSSITTATLLSHPQPWPSTSNQAPSLSSSNPNPCSGLLRIPSAASRRRDSNAEPFRTQNWSGVGSGENNEFDGGDDDDDRFRRRRRRVKRRWWSDEGSSPGAKEEPGIFEEFIENVSIFEAFSSYGWALPFIILSMLLATGPKAFLMAIALPLGQLALTSAFKKLFERAPNVPKRKAKTNKKPGARAAGSTKPKEEEDQDTVQRARDYQSWVATDDVSGSKESQNASTFGGWNELEREGKFKKRPPRRPVRPAGTGMEKGKFTRRQIKSETPLLLRLLIAVFPFLGSWTKML